MKKWLFSLKEDRIFYKIVAFTLSFILWFYVLNGQEIEGEKRIKINYITPKGMTLLKDVPKEVILTYRGPRLYLNRNKVKKSIEIKLSRRHKKINIHQSMLPQLFGLELVGFSPSEVLIELDREVKKKVSLIAPDGFTLVKKNFMTVQGPKKILKNLHQVKLNIDEDENPILPPLGNFIKVLGKLPEIKKVTVPVKID